ncbi:MAG: response regulator [Deltaproteobacteria bacterium]|nr:response regulator [Deltaproteobacteria bacterium]
MSKRALVVDNDFFFVEFLSDLLNDRGYEVTKAYDGKEAITKLKDGPVDIVFVDMVMPKIDGKQFIQFTRKKFPESRFPIVAVSSTLVERFDAIDEVGADYYVAKGPIDTMATIISELLDKLERQGVDEAEGDNFLQPERVYPRQATAELLENLDYERAIVESMGIGIIAVDKDARIISSNSLALSIIGKPLEEVLDNHVTTIFSERDYKMTLVKELKRVLRHGEVRKSSFLAWAGPQQVLVVVSTLRVQGTIVGWIIVLEDDVP